MLDPIDRFTEGFINIFHAANIWRFVIFHNYPVEILNVIYCAMSPSNEWSWLDWTNLRWFSEMLLSAERLEREIIEGFDDAL